MKIDTTVERPDGSLQFSGVLEGEELTAVINFGLNTIYALGLIKASNITYENEEDDEGEEEDGEIMQ